MTQRESNFAKYLSLKGEKFSNELHDYNHSYFTSLNGNYFAIACAISLCWTGHAKYEDAFVTYASSYIQGVTTKNHSISHEYSKRFGIEELDSTLTNFRLFYKEIKHLLPDFNTCSIHDINRLQQRLLNLLNQLRTSRKIIGIGPWLFLGPFKIILIDQKRLWDNDGINSIILPTGMEVDRGINRLINEEYIFMNDFDSNWLKEATGSLLDNYATCQMVHTHIIKIAELSQSSALHINSSLYEYGKDLI